MSPATSMLDTSRKSSRSLSVLIETQLDDGATPAAGDAYCVDGVCDCPQAAHRVSNANVIVFRISYPPWRQCLTVHTKTPYADAETILHADLDAFALRNVCAGYGLAVFERFE